MIISMLSNYLLQTYITQSTPAPVTGTNYLLYNIDIIFQTSMVAVTIGFVLACMMATPSLGYGIGLFIQGGIGVYWPAMGYFRGKVIVPELRNTMLLFPK
jgi:hypothetical protein